MSHHHWHGGGRWLRTLLPLIMAENILKSHDIGDRVPTSSRSLPSLLAWRPADSAPLAPYFFHLEGREERIADWRGQFLTDEAAALREANLVAAALRMYRGEAWRVIVTNEWGHEVTPAPTPLEATA
jgi:hypothetical protein